MQQWLWSNGYGKRLVIKRPAFDSRHYMLYLDTSDIKQIVKTDGRMLKMVGLTKNKKQELAIMSSRRLAIRRTMVRIPWVTKYFTILQMDVVRQPHKQLGEKAYNYVILNSLDDMSELKQTVYFLSFCPKKNKMCIQIKSIYY